LNNIINDDIQLIEPGHRYVLNTHPEIQFKSATTILAEYFEPFDSQKIAANLVATNVKYIGMEATELIAKWDAARDYGSKVHSEIELYLKENISPDEIESHDAIKWLNKYQMKSEIEIHSEVRIYSKELKIAGTIDILAHDKRTDMYEIIDWKTAKSITTTSFNGKMGTHPITSHLMDCKFVHYSMQLSLYRYLLEEYYGLNISNQLIAHLNENTCVAHVGDYYKKEVLDIIQAQKN